MTTLILALLLADTANAESGCHAVVDVRALLPSGATDGVDIIWEGDRIRAVGTDLSTAGCTVHRAAWVTPGFVAVGTQLGLMEVELEPGTRDDAWEGDPIRAAFQPGLAYDPRSVVVPIARSGGLTSAIVVPAPALIAGQAAAVSLRTGAQAEALVDPSAALVVHPDALGSLAAGLARLGEVLEDARRVASGKDPWAEVERVSAGRVDLVAIGAALKGELPVLVHVDQAADIEAVLRLADTWRLRLVIAGGAEAWMVADRLAAARVPVALDPMVYGPGTFDQLRGRSDNAALLAAAGVPVMLLTTETHNARSARFAAGNAVRAGLPHATAIAALTSVPAQAFGLADRGVLQAGAVADLALWSDDPLDTPGRLLGLVIAGALQDPTTRQTELVEAWRTLPRVPDLQLPKGAVAP